MNKGLFLLCILCTIMSFSLPGLNDFIIPEQKIGRTIEELFSTQSFKLKMLNQSDIDCIEEPYSKQIQVFDKNTLLGNVYIRRVHTCDPLACKENSTVQPSTNIEDLEYFDYFVIVDKDTVIKNITVYNYQATHGHEVAKRNWLSQFLNQPEITYFEYGDNIDAISGATVSAQNFTNDISFILDCLHR